MRNERLLYIDGLKGIGCLIVFFFHYFSTFNTFLWGVDFIYKYPSPLSIFIDGIWAVRVFVILSAFSISYSLAGGGNIQNVIIKRYFRLSVPIAIVTLLTFVLQIFYYNIEVANLLNVEWIKVFSPDYSIDKLILNVLLGIPCGICDFLGVIWMIKYLFWGAFFVIILKLGINNLNKIKANLILLLFLVISYKVSDLYTCIVLGVFLEYNYSMLVSIKQRRANVLSIILLTTSMFIHMNILSISQGIINICSSSLFVISIMINPAIRLFLSKQMFLFFGKISFQIYLLHCPIIFSLSCFLYLYLPIQDIALKMYAILVVTIVCVIFTSFISYKYIEMKLSERFVKKILTFFKS